MFNKLIYIANSLDKKGFRKEADALDGIIKKSFYFFYTKCKGCGEKRDVDDPDCKRCEKKKMSKKASKEYNSNLEMLDEAISILSALRREMDPNFEPELGDEEPAPNDPYLTESAWNALEKDYDL